jgi:O-methyltransferase involved in polyketide biosynthesis
MHDTRDELLSGPQATLLMPLWARAMETRREDAILRDETAVRIVSEITFDFEALRRKQVPVADYCIRSRLVDALVSAEMQRRPRAPVVEFGVGLDTRFDRLHDGRRWIEMDFPDVMGLRSRFVPQSSEREQVSARLPDCAWLDALDLTADEPPIFVAEGVLYFLRKRDVQRLFRELTNRYPGAAIVFDAQSWAFLAFSNMMHPLRARSSRLLFSVEGQGDELPSWDHRLVVEQTIGFADLPAYAPFLHRLSPFKQIVARFHPLTRHVFKVLLVRLGRRGEAR